MILLDIGMRSDSKYDLWEFMLQACSCEIISKTSITFWSLTLESYGVFGLRNEVVHHLLIPHFFCLVCEME